MPLKVIIYESPSSRMFRRGIMATQLLATLTIVYHLLRCGIVVYLVNLRHLLHSIPMDVCLVSQLERGCYVSFRELILSCSFLRRLILLEFSFPLLVMLVGVLRERLRDNDGDQINALMKCTLDREDYTSCVSPSLYPTLESRDEIFV